MEYKIKSQSINGLDVDLDEAFSKIILYDNKVYLYFPVNSGEGNNTIEGNNLIINDIETTCKGLVAIGDGEDAYDRAAKHTEFEDLWIHILNNYPGKISDDKLTITWIANKRVTQKRCRLKLDCIVLIYELSS